MLTDFGSSQKKLKSFAPLQSLPQINVCKNLLNFKKRKRPFLAFFNSVLHKPTFGESLLIYFFRSGDDIPLALLTRGLTSRKCEHMISNIHADFSYLLSLLVLNQKVCPLMTFVQDFPQLNKHSVYIYRCRFKGSDRLDMVVVLRLQYIKQRFVSIHLTHIRRFYGENFFDIFPGYAF